MTNGFAADVMPSPDPSIKLLIEVDGKPVTGLIELERQVHSNGNLSSEQKAQFGPALEAAVIPYKRGSTMRFTVKVLQANSQWLDVTADPRLLVTVMQLTFDRTGRLIGTPEGGLPAGATGILFPVDIFFWPDEKNRQRYGYDQIYFKAVD
jgi:hypothetical protein